MAASARFEVGNLLFDAPAGELTARAQTKRLEPKAAAVLAALCVGRGDVVSRQSLLDHCWGEGEGSDEALTQAVAQIRRAIEELGERADVVETLAKRGYRLREKEAAPAGPLLESAATETPPQRPRRRAIIAGLVMLLLILTWIALPHGPRHFIRHTPGFGPPSSDSH